MNLLENYIKARQKLYDHVGFVEDWVIYPIDDFTSYVWYCDGKEVKYAENLEKFNSSGDYYTDEIYTQRFYDKWIYEGKDFTMIFCNPHVDGMIWFKVFDNTKKIKS